MFLFGPYAVILPDRRKSLHVNRQRKTGRGINNHSLNPILSLNFEWYYKLGTCLRERDVVKDYYNNLLDSLDSGTNGNVGKQGVNITIVVEDEWRPNKAEVYF